ncbi:putative arabinose efflux permease, MFS family [Geosmithia morbida]|uniref:Arabinose efflux permease, MFS family n=1 Tax=Geosmithia morbida TaxID=1094350 RepID=A0A9P4YU66_9HYPO|nr:putative arabinose efflux permease, MFS family [Geosmithia morbida]KAF4122880.1 putative arabinose efflux permease, MFS family [Geosmithia morbida]
MKSSPDLEEVASQTLEENVDPGLIKRVNIGKGADRAAELIGDQHVDVTEEDDRRIRHKTDLHILTILTWVYFLQILDKSTLGYGAITGMREDCNLSSAQYSLVSSIAPIAQLAWQPFSSWLIVRVPHRILMPTLCLGWGIAQTCMAACSGYGSLLATRFLLGLFEAGCLPLFSVITSQWYRRAEQPVRVACWYSTNGVATIFAAAVSYGLTKVEHPVLQSWRILFLFVGLLTIVTAPIVYWFLDSDVAGARFLNDFERLQAIERLRANQTGTGSREFKWNHVQEALLETKAWLFMGIALTLNITTIVTNTFGPLLLEGIGMEKSLTSLLNMPFGALQVIVIMPSAYLAHRLKIKSAPLAALMLPVLAGILMLYLLPRDRTASLLAAYYLLAFGFAGNPIIVSWMVSNTAGTTKKSVVMSIFNAGSSAGNIIGPLLFSTADAPEYKPGLRKTMGTTCALVGIVGLLTVNLWVLNRFQEHRREQNGKPRKLRDLSMENRYTSERQETEDGVQLGTNAFKDLTDRENDEFVYIY